MVKQKKFRVKNALIPNYYKSFACINKDCADNCCCVEWSISFNEEDCSRLKSLDLPEETKKLIDTSIVEVNNTSTPDLCYAFDLKSNDDKCPFFNEDGLCSIQLACGHDALPNVCTSYPRKSSYTMYGKIYAISPSCEALLKQFWELTGGVRITERKLPRSEWVDILIDAGNNLGGYADKFLNACLDILQDRSKPLSDRMFLLGLTLREFEKEDWTNFDAAKWAQKAVEISAIAPALADISGNPSMFIAQNLEIVATVKNNLLFKTLNDMGLVGDDLLMHFGVDDYLKGLNNFKQEFSDREYFFENLTVSAALYTVCPNIDSKEALWKSYVGLCNIYGFFMFMSVLSCMDGASKEKLYHMLVIAARALLHNSANFEIFREELFQSGSSTLAHMAILLRWEY